MDDSENVSIAVKKLEDCLTRELETLHPMSNARCIYRVAEPDRRLNPSDYTPQMVSIGPYHHGKEELKAMEEQKKRYVICFLRRPKVPIPMASFISFIIEREADLRNCYAEATDNLQSDDFVKMVLVDAVFLIELFLRRYIFDLRTGDDCIFSKPHLYLELRRDLWLVENQLPLFVLKGLYDVAKTATDNDVIYNQISFLEITCSFVRGTIGDLLPEAEEGLLESHFSEAKHFVDLIILCFQPLQPRGEITLGDQKIPSVKELHQAGVKFKPAAGPTKNLLDIKFNQGILEIPFLTVYDTTERLFKNLLAFERMHHCPEYFNDYIIMMSRLVNAPKDAELLVRNEIIGLGGSETLPPLILNNLDKECGMDNDDFQYAGVVAKLNAYCKSPWHNWKANLKQNYFNTPWASISVIAAVILLLFAATQTIASLIAL